MDWSNHGGLNSDRVKGVLMKRLMCALLVAMVPAPRMMAEDSSERRAPQVRVTVDPRIELLAVVQMLTRRQHELGRVSRYSTVYKKDCHDYFAMYATHPAVDVCDQLMRKGFSYDAPPAAMLYLSAPPELKIEQPLSDYLKKRVGSQETFEAFVKQLRAFARASDFMSFYHAHKGTYNQIVADTTSRVHLDDAQHLEAYYGTTQLSYTILLAPLYHHGGYGMGVERERGQYDIYSIQGPQGTRQGYPYFGDEAGLRYVTWHEFSHSFVNPITEHYEEQVEAIAPMYDPVQTRMERMAYKDWPTCLNEHVVRAVTIRLTQLHEGDEAARKLLAEEKRRGFIYIDTVLKALLTYEARRERHPELRAFYPVLLERLKEAHLETSADIEKTS